MKTLENWPWKIYTVLFSLVVIGNLTSILSEDSFLYTYYHILLAFRKEYTLLYYLALTSAFVNLIALVPLILYTLRINFLPPRLWQWLFTLRLAFDLFGHSYELKQIRSFFAADVIQGILVLIPLILTFFPSYIALYKYAFRRE